MIAEVVIVDNGSREPIVQVVRGVQALGRAVRLIREDAGGKSIGLNTGMRRSSGRVVLFSDDDVRFPGDWLERMAEPILQGTVDVVPGAVRIAPHLLRPWMTPMHRSWLASTEEIDFATAAGLVGANMAIARKAVEAVGGFDPDLGPGALGYMDDTLLGTHLKAAGYQFSRQAGSTVEHHFTADRLSRAAMLRAASAHGRTLAHVAWHYNGWRLPLLRLRRLKQAIAVKAHAWQGARPPDHATDCELNDEKGRAFFQQFAIERRRLRKVSQT
jgi:glycosyltransferase involved in cell wall biosynthesis